MLFILVFVSQILSLSLILPRMHTKRYASKEMHPGEAAVSRYLAMNHALLAAGLLALAFIFFHPVFVSVTYTLLAIGVYFILQLMPIALNSELFAQPDITEAKSEAGLSLFEVVRPLTVGVAIALFISYSVVSLAAWKGGFDTQLLRGTIFIGVNAYLAVATVKGIRSVSVSNGEEKRIRIEHAYRTVPFFIYISIGISVYYFGTRLLFGLTLHEYRPVMMSVFIQLLGLLIFNRIGRGHLKDTPDLSKGCS